MWISPTLPGARHDLDAAHEHRIIDALTEAGIDAVADTAYHGYVLEGEMVFELEGDAPVMKRAGDTIWEPGGDRIHYQAANPGHSWLRFVVVMACKEGEEMLTFVSPEELEERKHLRHPGPVVDPRVNA